MHLPHHVDRVVSHALNISKTFWWNELIQMYDALSITIHHDSVIIVKKFHNEASKSNGKK